MIIIKNLFRKARLFLLIKLHEKTFGDKGRYLHLKKGSDKLIIVFSGFNQFHRRYNYIDALNGLQIDRLYILDSWSKTGSYYMYENGENYPETIVQNIINQVVRGYKQIFTAGSSMGGTCAIYYGLKYHASHIFAGACQYNIGSFVHRKDHEYIFKAMMGEHAGQQEADLLNNIMSTVIEENHNCNAMIHLLYSQNELTYQRQIIDLLNKLHECNFSVVEQIESFSNHSDVGKYFAPYLRAEVKRLI